MPQAGCISAHRMLYIMKNNISLLLVLFLFVILAGCAMKSGNSQSDNNTSDLEISSITPEETADSSPTIPPTEPSTMPTFTPTPVGPPTLDVSVPANISQISTENTSRLKVIDQWGDGLIYKTDFLDNGERFYTVSTTGLRIYDTISLEILLHVNEDIYDEFGVVWTVSSDGKWFVLYDHDFDLRIWSLSSNKLEYSKHYDEDYLGCTPEPVFSPDNSKLAMIGECNGVQEMSRLTILEVPSWKEILHEVKRGRGVFTSSGDLVTYPLLGRNVGITLWKSPSFRIAKEFDGELTIVCSSQYIQKPDNPWPTYIKEYSKNGCLSVSPTGSIFALSAEGDSGVYDLNSFELLFPLPQGERPEFVNEGDFLILDNGISGDSVYSMPDGDPLSFLPKVADVELAADSSHLIGKRIVQVSNTHYEVDAILLFEVVEGTQVAVFEDYSIGYFSQNGKYLVLFTEPSQVYKSPIIVDPSDGSVLVVLENEKPPVLSQNEKYFATTSMYGTEIYRLDTLEHIANVSGIWPQFTPDSNYLLTTDAGNIYRWAVDTGEFEASAAYHVAIKELQISDTGDFWVETSAAGIRIVEQPEMVISQTAPPDGFISPSGEYSAYYTGSSVDVYRASTNELLFSVIESSNDNISFNSDSTLLALTKSKKIIEVYSMDSGEVVQTLTADYDIKKIIFSPDSKRVYALTEKVTGGSSPTTGTVSGWILDTGQLVLSRGFSCREKKGHVNFLSGSMALSLDGAYLAYTSDQCQTIILEIETLGVVQTIDDWGNVLALSQDGTIIAITSNRGGGTRLWNVATGELIKTIIDNPVNYERYQNMINQRSGYSFKGQWGVSLAFSPDGKYLIHTADGIAILLGVEP